MAATVNFSIPAHRRRSKRGLAEDTEESRWADLFELTTRRRSPEPRPPLRSRGSWQRRCSKMLGCVRPTPRAGRYGRRAAGSGGRGTTSCSESASRASFPGEAERRFGIVPIDGDGGPPVPMKAFMSDDEAAGVLPPRRRAWFGLGHDWNVAAYERLASPKGQGLTCFVTAVFGYRSAWARFSRRRALSHRVFANQTLACHLPGLHRRKDLVASRGRRTSRAHSPLVHDG